MASSENRCGCCGALAPVIGPCPDCGQEAPSGYVEIFSSGYAPTLLGTVQFDDPEFPLPAPDAHAHAAEWWRNELRFRCRMLGRFAWWELN